jgi:hypothetical protein
VRTPPPGRAPLVVAAVLFALALPRPSPPPATCPHVRALSAPGGHTRAVACAATRGDPPLRGPARLLFQLPIDPNRADAATLELLPGIGAARAQAILRERARRPFARPDDLLRVHGIGPVTLARLRPWIATPAADRSGLVAEELDPAALQRNR